MQERRLLRFRDALGVEPFLRVAAASLILLMLACACQGGDDGQKHGDRATTEPARATSTTAPPGTDTAAVKPLVADLIARLNEVTDRIVQDPIVVNDPGSELIDEFTSIYAPDAEGLTGGLNAFRQSAADGTHLEPLNADTTGQTELTGDVETVDDDTVKVPVCEIQTYRKLDSNGSVIEYIDHLAQPGEVWAVRTDHGWRLQRSDLFENTICTAQVAPA